MCAQPLKDGLNPAVVERIAAVFAAVEPGFDQSGFVEHACDGLDELELKDRVIRIAEALNAALPQPFPTAVAAIVRAAEAWPEPDPDDNFGAFAAWPMTDFIGLYGVDHPEDSLPALRRLTPLFSAEFAIRPFLIAHRDRTLASLEEWVGDPDHHVRRLVSEGTRPRLPWGQRLRAFQDDPAPALGFLERLKDDSSEYVRRSVANHLNDISKDHPALALEVCGRWSQDAGPERRRLIRHALRSLLKQGEPRALSLLGYDDGAEVVADGFSLTPRSLSMGDSLAFSLALTSTGAEPQDLLVDYAIHHRKANGDTAPKVFRLKTLDLAPGATVRLSKRHPFRPITTRRYYSGTHEIEVIVNGRSVAREAFELVVQDSAS